MENQILSENFNEWGVPYVVIDRPKKEVILPIKAADLKEAKNKFQAEKQLDLIKNKIDSMLLEAKAAAVDIDVPAQKKASATINIKVIVDLSDKLEQIKNESAREEDPEYFIETEFEKIFTNKQFIESLDKEIWNMIKRMGEFEGSHVELEEYPKYDPSKDIHEYQNLELDLVLTVQYGLDRIDMNALKEKIKSEVESEIKF